jgi:hypothetical protein
MKDKILATATNLGLLIWAFMSPVRSLMLLTGSLVILDFILGIWAAKRRGEAITSNRMRHTISKTLAYQMALLGSFMLDGIIEEHSLLISRAVAVLIGSTELKSLLESLHDITGLDLWAAVIEKLKPPPKV